MSSVTTPLRSVTYTLKQPCTHCGAPGGRGGRKAVFRHKLVPRIVLCRACLNAAGLAIDYGTTTGGAP